MYCKLCGKHLYKNITFHTLFQIDYYLHESCEQTINKNKTYITFPLLDKLVYVDYIFEQKTEKSDEIFLFQKYSKILYNRLLESADWSIVVFVDTKLDHQTMILLMKLAKKSVLFCSVFHENFM